MASLKRYVERSKNFFFKSSPQDVFIDFERGREGGGERDRQTQKDRHRCERETSISFLPYMPQLGWNPQPFGV